MTHHDSKTITKGRPRVLGAALLCLGAAMCAHPARAQDSTGADRAAATLRRGDVEVVLRARDFIIPGSVVDGVKIQPTVGVRWMAADRLQLTLDAQTVDNAGPGRQGHYRASRTLSGSTASGNFLQEVALQARARIWGGRGASERNALTLVGALSRGGRSYHLTDVRDGTMTGGNRREVVPTAALAFEHGTERGSVSIGAAAAFLPADNALYLRRSPDRDDRFGTVIGPELAGRVPLGAGFSAWGRTFLPLSGANSIARGSGRAARAVAYDAGLTLRLNPALDAELFASNVLGNTGALAYIADREYHAVSAGLVFRPGERFASAGPGRAPRDSVAATMPMTLASVSASTLPRGRASLMVAGGSQGFLGAIDVAPVDGLQFGAFLDYTGGHIDEGELGVSARVRVLDEQRGALFTLGLVAAVSRTNNPLVNLLAGRRDQLEHLGLGKGGFHFGDESVSEGRLYVLTAALPIERWVTGGTRIRLVPIVDVIQREGLQLAGVAFGVEQSLDADVALGADVGADFSSKGNVLSDEGRTHATPWRAGFSWRPGSVGSGIVLDGYATNRVGASPFHTLRVRADNRVGFGVGVRAAF